MERKLKVFTEDAAKLSLGLILVGTKKDLAEDEKSSTTQGWDLAKALSAQEYLECSAISSHDDIKELFEHVIDISKSRDHKTLFVSDKKSLEASSESLSQETDNNKGNIYRFFPKPCILLQGMNVRKMRSATFHRMMTKT